MSFGGGGGGGGHSTNKFHENTSSGSRVVPCGQADGWTDMTKLIERPSRRKKTVVVWKVYQTIDTSRNIKELGERSRNQIVARPLSVYCGL